MDYLSSAESVDTQVNADAAAGDGGNWILDYVKDAHYVELNPFGKIALPQFSPVEVFGLTIDLSPTKYVVYMWVAALILIVLFTLVAKNYRRSLVPHGLTNLFEVVILFIRDEIAIPNIGPDGKRFLPLLMTLFFFIMTCNLLGLVPWGVSSTENINVTAGLALVSFFTVQFAGMWKNGVWGYLRGLVPPGMPTFVLPVMVVVEFIGLFTKPFALTVRLFANMTSGKIVILSLIGLIFFFHSYIIAPVSVAFTLFIMALKMFISLLQAYIFTMLTALFIGMAVHQEH